MLDAVVDFKKVSYEEFYKDVVDLGITFDDEVIRDAYNNIRLPELAEDGVTYKFYSPLDIKVDSLGVTTIPTGIKCGVFKEGWALDLRDYDENIRLCGNTMVTDDNHIMLNVKYDFSTISSISRFLEYGEGLWDTLLEYFQDLGTCFSKGDTLVCGYLTRVGVTYDDHWKLTKGNVDDDDYMSY